MSHCENCGTKLSDGICPNCEEELFITVEQAGDLEGPFSDEWNRKVDEQIIAVRARSEREG